MTVVTRLTILVFLLAGVLQVIPNALAGSCSADVKCVPTNACDACRKLKCTLAKNQGFGNINCDNLTPLIGGNQCCDLTRASQLGSRKKRQAYNFDREPQRKWPNPVGYAFDTTDLQPFKAVIPSVLSYIQAQTCLRFQEVAVNATTPHITYTRGSSCTAYVGRSEYDSTPITVTSDCLSKFGEMLYYTVQTLGMWHQSQREDRDQYITINTTNTDPVHIGDFSTLDSSVLVTLGLPYDFASIQHFPAKIYTKNGFFTIITNNPLYQMTIGQMVQLSFQDAKLLNLLYCQGSCSSNQLAGVCQNGGYQDPNNCTRCRCPDGFAGQLCNQYDIETGGICGETKNASLAEMSITSPGYASPGYYDSNAQTACNWRIVAPRGGNISLRFTDQFGIFQDPSYACYHWVEVRYKGLRNETGPRFCGQTLPQVELISDRSEVLIIFRSNLSGQPQSSLRGFKISYKVVNAPSCAYVTCLNGGSCLNDVCTCPQGTTGVTCETRTSFSTEQPASLAPTTLAPSSCNPNPCRNNGTCVATSSGIQCSCINGFTGQYCTDAPCGGCKATPGIVQAKCIIPENPRRVCQVTDTYDSTSGWWLWCRRTTRTVARNVTCTWAVCCDNVTDVGNGCAVLGWSEWCPCTTKCGGGQQVRNQYGLRTDRIGNLNYGIVSTQQKVCNTQKCICDGSRRTARGRWGYPWMKPPCQVCNGPSFIESGDQCVPSTSTSPPP